MFSKELLDWLKTLKKWGLQITYEPNASDFSDSERIALCRQALNEFATQCRCSYTLPPSDIQEIENIAPLMDDVCLFYQKKNIVK